MSLIDSTYFRSGLMAIPNLKDENLEQLNTYIELYEPIYLEKMLGLELKNEFLTGLEQPTPDQKWIDLRDGKEYYVSDRLYKWRGFVNAEKKSPIAMYVFSKLTNDNQVQNTGLGESKADSENSTVIIPQYRVGNVWTNMAQLNRELYHFLSEFNDDYDTWYFDHCYKSLLKPSNAIGI